MFLTASYKRESVIEAILLHTDCTTEKQAVTYLESMYNDGMTLDDCYNFFIIMAPTGV